MSALRCPWSPHFCCAASLSPFCLVNATRVIRTAVIAQQRQAQVPSKSPCASSFSQQERQLHRRNRGYLMCRAKQVVEVIKLVGVFTTFQQERGRPLIAHWQELSALLL